MSFLLDIIIYICSALITIYGCIRAIFKGRKLGMRFFNKITKSLSKLEKIESRVLIAEVGIKLDQLCKYVKTNPQKLKVILNKLKGVLNLWVQ